MVRTETAEGGRITGSSDRSDTPPRPSGKSWIPAPTSMCRSMNQRGSARSSTPGSSCASAAAYLVAMAMAGYRPVARLTAARISSTTGCEKPEPEQPQFRHEDDPRPERGLGGKFDGDRVEPAPASLGHA